MPGVGGKGVVPWGGDVAQPALLNTRTKETTLRIGPPTQTRRTLPGPGRMNKRAASLVAGLVVAGLVVARPGHGLGLYEARAITTGMALGGHGDALAACFAEVLAKVSGGEAGTPAQDEALGALAAYAYVDRMANIPIHDEQGTRDRPYDLLVRFDRAAVAAALGRRGLRAWLGADDRPTVVVDVEITTRRGEVFSMRPDTVADEGHRAAVLAAADRAGLPIVIGGAGPQRLDGTLVWSEVDAGWSYSWTLSWPGHRETWSGTGAGYDAAYRIALGGALARLAR